MAIVSTVLFSTRPVRRLAPIVAVVMVYLMTPGGFELTENALHLVGHGDVAHGDDHGADGAADEHGCSGPYHFCICHHSITFVAAPVAVTPLTQTVAAAPDMLAIAGAIDSGYIIEIDHPPQA